MTKTSVIIAAAFCAALTIPVGARAQDLSCRAETAGQTLCQQSRLCQCQYFAGGALTDSSAGFRWDCAAFRPRCEAGSAGPGPGSQQGGPVGTAADRRGLDLVAAEGLEPEKRAQPDAGWLQPDAPLFQVETAPEVDAEDPVVFDLIAAEGLGPVPVPADTPVRETSATGAIVLAALNRWAQALWSAPRPERRISKAPVPRLGDRFVQQAAQAEQTRVRLEVKIAALKDTLGQERQRISDLEDQRRDLELNGARLARQLREMGEIQQAALDRLADHASLEIAVFEQTVAMAGLDVAALLAEDRVDDLEAGQGGPFIPEQYLVAPDPVEAAAASLSVLDDRVARWERLQELLQSLPLAAPLEQYRISSAFGPRKDPVNGRRSRHLGLDFRAKLGTPVLSTAPGQVVFAAWKGRYGRLVEIDHGHGIRTRYAHLHKVLVKPGQVVGHRESIGLLGSSGRSTGPHVHYEVLVNGKQHDPMNFLKAGIHAFKTAGRDDELLGENKDP